MLFQMSEFSLYEVASLYQWPRVIASLPLFNLNQSKYLYCVTNGLTNALHWNWQWIKQGEVKCFCQANAISADYAKQSSNWQRALSRTRNCERVVNTYASVDATPPWTLRRQSPPPRRFVFIGKSKDFPILCDYRFTTISFVCEIHTKNELLRWPTRCVDTWPETMKWGTILVPMTHQGFVKFVHFISLVRPIYKMYVYLAKQIIGPTPRLQPRTFPPRCLSAW